MLELLAIAERDAGPTTLDAWIDALRRESGCDVAVDPEPPDGAWLEMGVLRARGYAVLHGALVEAIHFELASVDPAPALAVLSSAAAALRWELHEDDDDEEGDDD